MSGDQLLHISDIVRAFRARAGKSPLEFAECLYASGFTLGGDPAALADKLDVLEGQRQWPFDVPEVRPFCEACKACLGLDGNDAHTMAFVASLVVIDIYRIPSPPLVPPPSPATMTEDDSSAY